MPSVTTGRLRTKSTGCVTSPTTRTAQIHTGTEPQVMAALRNAAISVLRLTGATNIAAATRHHAPDNRRPLDLLKIS